MTGCLPSPALPARLRSLSCQPPYQTGGPNLLTPVCLCVLSCLPRDLLAEGAGSRPDAGRISDPNSIKHDAGGGHTIVQVRLRYDELPPNTLSMPPHTRWRWLCTRRAAEGVLLGPNCCVLVSVACRARCVCRSRTRRARRC